MKRYLLPCSCSRRIAVAAVQAGGAVRCPDCGSTLQVPRLGELATLESSAEHTPDRPSPGRSSAGRSSAGQTSAGRPADGPAAAGARDWSAARALLLAGVATMIVAVAAAAWLRGRRAGVAPINEQAIREKVGAAPIDLVHTSWLEFERQGIARPPVPEEERRLRAARGLAALETVAWIAAGAGGVIAAAAVLAEWIRRLRGIASR